MEEEKLNLGCGMDLLPGYTNIDIQKHLNIPPNIIFRKGDCKNLSYFKDKSISEIYAKGLVEHIHPLNIKEYLYEWNRVLKINGKLILIFPDFDAVVSDYKQCKNLKSLDDFMMFLAMNYAILNTNQSETVRSDSHRSLITPKFLKLLLKSEGFLIDSIVPYDKECNRYTKKLIAKKVRID